jgi:hypothetical protein
MDGAAASGAAGVEGAMLEKLDAIGRTAAHAAELIVDRTATVDPWALALGTLLYLAAQTVRPRGWHTILRAAFPEATDLRPRDVIRAYLAGAGVNALVPARGGDVVKLALLRRRIEGAPYATLAATFIPETLFETAFGAGLVAWALAEGFIPVPTTSGELPALDVSLVLGHPVPAALALVALGVVGRRLVRVLRGALRQGTAILSSPRRFLLGVASWQALARLIRLGSMAAFMAAFGLPVTPATVVLVMAAQGAGRILPLAPASAGLRLAMLSYGFVEVTGHPVDIAAITAFTFGVGAVLAMSGLLVAIVILAQEFGTLSPWRALAAARGTARPAPAGVRAARGESPFGAEVLRGVNSLTEGKGGWRSSERAWLRPRADARAAWDWRRKPMVIPRSSHAEAATRQGPGHAPAHPSVDDASLAPRGAARLGGDHSPASSYWMSTGVPTGTRLNRSMTSATCMRMQPCDAREPIE